MSKRTIDRLFAGSLAALLVGVVLVLVTVAAFLCTATWTTSGTQVTQFEVDKGITWTIWFAVAGGIIAAVGGLGQLVAWIGALVNTARLEDKLWFIVLLVTGIFSFGFIAMLVYVLMGPDRHDRSARVNPAGNPARLRLRQSEGWLFSRAT
jgi:hypothetical protein